VSDSRAAALFAAGVSAVLAIAYWVARWGLACDSPLVIAQVLGIAWFILLLPSAASDAASGRVAGGRDDHRWYLAQPTLTVAALLVLVLAGFAADRTGLPLGAAFAVCGVLLLAWTLTRIAGCLRTRLRYAIVAVVATSVFAILIAGQVWAWGYLSPVFLEKVALGVAHQDTLFNASISSMIRTYGIPSTGLDGLPFIRYHFGSHWILAWLSALARISPLDFYQLGYPVVLVPLFLQSLMGFATSASTRLFGGAIRLRSRRGLAAWMVLALSFATVLPGELGLRAGIYGIVTSESYLVSMMFMFLTASIMLECLGKGQGPVSSADRVLLLLALPVLLFFIGMSKISVLALTAALLAYYVLRLGLYKQRHFMAAVGIGALISVLALFVTTPTGMGGGLALLPYIRDYVAYGVSMPVKVVCAMWFFAAHYLWSWLYVVLRLRSLGATSLARLREVWSDRAALDVEAVVVFSLLGVIPGLCVSIPGGSAAYFSGVQQWLAVGLLMGLLPGLVERAVALGVLGKPWHRVRWRMLFCLLLVGVISSATLWGGVFVSDQVATRAAILSAADGSEPVELPSLASMASSGDSTLLRSTVSSALASPRAALDGNANYQLLLQLRSAAGTRRGQSGRTAVFVPREYSTYWSMQNNPSSSSWRAAFLVPALTEMAAVDGLPESPPTGLTYGFSTYVWDPRVSSVAEASKRAASMGFDRLIVFDGAKAGGTVVETH